MAPTKKPKVDEKSVLLKAVKDAKIARKSEDEAKAAKEAALNKRGIILLSHIPHGFYEEETRGYFSQFGNVLRLKLARSKRTGKSKGYAFVEFEFEEVAKIVSEAMDGYLMYERLLKCELLPSTVDTKALFNQSYIREDNYPKLHAIRRVKDEQSKKKTDEEVKEFMEFRMKKLKEQNKKWKSLGIDYKYTPPKVAKTT